MFQRTIIAAMSSLLLFTTLIVPGFGQVKQTFVYLPSNDPEYLLEGDTTQTDAATLEVDFASDFVYGGNGFSIHGNSFSLQNHHFRITLDAPLPTAPITNQNSAVQILSTPSDVVAYIQQQLKRSAEEAALTPEQVAGRIQELDPQIPELDGRRLLATELQDAVQKNSRHGDLIAARMTHLRDEIQTAQDILSDKEIRSAALAKAIEAQKAQLEADTSKDPIAKILQDQVNDIQQSVDILKTRSNNGLASVDDLNNIQIQLSNTKVKLAERLEVLKQSGAGDVLSRLSGEMALISVDIAEQQMRLKDLSSQLDLFQKALIDPDALQQLIQKMPELSTPQSSGHSVPDELTAQLSKLRAEQLRLTISNLTVTVIRPTP